MPKFTPVKIRGRVFTDTDVGLIRELVTEHFERGRTYISKIVCEKLDWRQPNGWLKDRACRDVLRQLEALDLIELPPPLEKQKRSHSSSDRSVPNLLSHYDLETPIRSFPTKIELTIAKGDKDELLWNQLVKRYHYLGHKVIVGQCIKYIIRQSTEQLLGAIAFGSAAWRLSARDRILRQVGIEEPRNYTINNARFLILPNVQVKNLASHILSLATQQVVRDWESYYAITPLVAETFVQPSLYSGTCYLAANWIEVGRTRGYAKRGHSYRNSQEPKIILLYGLTKRIRRQLQEKMLEANHEIPPSIKIRT